MKDDTVSRAAVMQSLTKEYNRRRTGDGLKLAWIEKAVNEVPAVQTCEDAVSRADVLETYADLYDVFGDSKAICKELHKVYDRINVLPAVQPQRKTDEWCTDCREYDQEKHCCPRFNRVIRQTLSEQRKTGKWIDCDGSEHWKCDKCGCRAGYWFNEENSSSWELDMSEWLSNFCPNCGADMRIRGEQNG